MASIADTIASPRRPAPQRDPVFIWPSPNHADYLFWVERDGDIPGNKEWSYGDAYPDSAAHPNHKLVFVSPQNPGKWSKWYYASDRINQDEYNWEFTQADIGGVRFDAVARLYFYKRSEFKHTDSSGAPKQGDAMPNVPAGVFPASSFILAEREEVEAPVEELRSLYILEKRTYVLRSTISKVEHEDMLGVGQGSTITLYYRGESIGGVPIETLIAAPSNAYWGTQSDGTVRVGEQLTHRWFAVTTYSSLDSALEAYKLSFPSSVDMDIPDELTAVNVVWSVAGSNGSFASDARGRCTYVGDPEVSLGLSESANSECGGSIQADIVPTIRTRRGRDVPSTAWFFYIKSSATTLTAADVLSKLGTLTGSTVLQWPLFQPERHTFILKGSRASGRAQVSASGSVSTQYGSDGDQQRNNKEVSSAKGSSHDYSTIVTTVVLPETIHGKIDLTNPTPGVTTSFTATCSAGWNSVFTSATVAGHSIALPIPSNSDAGDLDPTSGGSGTVSQTTTINLTYGVTPTSLAATTPSEIPTSGLYMVGSPRIEPYKARWFRCSAQVVDASVFGP